MEERNLQQSENNITLIDALTVSDDLLALDLKVEWIVENLIPKQAITLLFGRGGSGKTWAALQIAKAVADGLPLWGKACQCSPVVYVDLENPLPILQERLAKIGTAPNFYIWHLSNTIIRPPLLDNENEWRAYRELPEGSLIIFDTLRAAHAGEENSSKDMALIMGRLKELREENFTLILLHHTNKASESQYKGSTAISDLCDHALCLEQVREDTLDLEGKSFCLETKDKTRFLPSKINLTFESYGFIEAEDPLVRLGRELKPVIEEMDETERFQSAIVKKAQENLDWNTMRTRRVLVAGVGIHWWKSDKRGRSGKVFFNPS